MGEDNKGSLGGVRVELEGPGRVAVRRETRESLAEVRVDDGARRDCTVATGLNFFDHMIETIAWNACLNVDVHFSHKRYRLTHVITEDVGLTLGRALARLLEERMPGGINGAGSGIMAIDEAIAIALISFEGRANGYYDLATPYCAAEWTFDHMQLDAELRGNLSFKRYEAGHMMYVHEPSIRQLRRDLGEFVEHALRS